MKFSVIFLFVFAALVLLVSGSPNKGEEEGKDEKKGGKRDHDSDNSPIRQIRNQFEKAGKIITGMFD